MPLPVRVNNFWSRSYIEYERNEDRNKNKTILKETYLNKIRTYLKDIMTSLKKSDTWKIQLTISINFTSCKDGDEERVMHSKSDNIEIIINNKADEEVAEFFQSLLSRGLESSMKVGSSMKPSSVRVGLESSMKSIVILSLTLFIYCILNVIKQIQIQVDHISVLKPKFVFLDGNLRKAAGGF